MQQAVGELRRQTVGGDRVGAVGVDRDDVGRAGLQQQWVHQRLLLPAQCGLGDKGTCASATRSPTRTVPVRPGPPWPCRTERGHFLGWSTRILRRVVRPRRLCRRLRLAAEELAGAGRGGEAPADGCAHRRTIHGADRPIEAGGVGRRAGELCGRYQRRRQRARLVAHSRGNERAVGLAQGEGTGAHRSPVESAREDRRDRGRTRRPVAWSSRYHRRRRVALRGCRETPRHGTGERHTVDRRDRGGEPRCIRGRVA